MTSTTLLKKRWQRIWSALAEARLDGLYVAGKGHIHGYGPFHYVSGHQMTLRYGAALILPGKEPILFVTTPAERILVSAKTSFSDVRLSSVPARDALEILGQRHANGFRLGVNDPDTYFTVSDYRGLSRVSGEQVIVDATALFEGIKAVKFPEEIIGIDNTYAIADKGFQTFLDVVRPGLSGWELASKVEEVITRCGVPDGLVFIGTGPHFLHWPEERVVERGDLITMFVEIVGPEGYWVERGGIVSLGPPSPEASRLVHACVEAFHTGSAMLRAGNRSEDVCEAIEKIARREGYTNGIWHGHGIGVDHDVPFFAPGDDTILQQDMFVALHPNFIDADNRIGASLADCFHITENGPRRLSQFKPELYVVG